MVSRELRSWFGRSLFGSFAESLHEFLGQHIRYMVSWPPASLQPHSFLEHVKFMLDYSFVFWPDDTIAVAMILFGLLLMLGALIGAVVLSSRHEGDASASAGHASQPREVEIVDEQTCLAPVGAFPPGLVQHLSRSVAPSFEVTGDDLQPLIYDVCAPFEQRRRTVLEWLRNVDLQAEHFARKFAGYKAVTEHLKEQTKMVDAMRQMALSKGAQKNVEFESHLARLAGYNSHLESVLKSIRLENEILAERSLRDVRLKSRQLEERSKHNELATKLRPARKKSPRKEFREHRKHVEATTNAQQEMLNTFHKHIRTMFALHPMDPEIKAAHIRGIVKSFGYDIDALPRKVREFVLRVEAKNHA